MPKHPSTINVLLIEPSQKRFFYYVQLFSQVEAAQEIDRPLELLCTPSLDTGVEQLHKRPIHLMLLSKSCLKEANTLTQVRSKFPDLTWAMVMGEQEAASVEEKMRLHGIRLFLKGPETSTHIAQMLQHV